MLKLSNQSIFKILFSLFAFSWAISTLVLIGEDKLKNQCEPHIWNYSLGWFVIYVIYGLLYLMTLSYNFFTKGNLSIHHMVKRYFYVNFFSLIFSLAIFLWGFTVVVADNCYAGIGLKQIATGNFVLTAFHIGVQMVYTWDEFKEGIEHMFESGSQCFRRTFQGESTSYPSAVTSTTSTSSDVHFSPSTEGATVPQSKPSTINTSDLEDGTSV